MCVPEKKNRQKFVKHYRELEVYELAFKGAMTIFSITRTFPAEEKYSLVDQIRRSSRSVCANIAESWRKRRYKLAFVSKLSDAETEAAETQVWLEFSVRSSYIDKKTYIGLDELYDKIIGKIVRMMQNSNQWLLPANDQSELRKRKS